MSSKDEVTLFGYHVVCLIDVLGQKQKLARWAKLPEDGQVTPELTEALKQTAGTVLGFRDQFIQLFHQLGQCTMPDKVAPLSPQQQERYRRFKECRVKVERFSDTFVFSSQIGNPQGDASTVPMYKVLAACCSAMLVSLRAGIPVRGAITIGAGAVLADGSFYGPALAEAHQLESEVAGHPRVVIAPNVFEFLDERQEYSQDGEVDALMKQMAAQCRHLTCQDVDGWRMVDFLGPAMREMVGGAAQFTDAVKKAYEFVSSASARYRTDADAKLAVRYHLVRQYVESRLGLWGLTPDEDSR